MGYEVVLVSDLGRTPGSARKCLIGIALPFEVVWSGPILGAPGVLWSGFELRPQPTLGAKLIFLPDLVRSHPATSSIPPKWVEPAGRPCQPHVSDDYVCARLRVRGGLGNWFCHSRSPSTVTPRHFTRVPLLGGGLGISFCHRPSHYAIIQVTVGAAHALMFGS